MLVGGLLLLAALAIGVSLLRLVTGDRPVQVEPGWGADRLGG